jgi:hypothetical protein
VGWGCWLDRKYGLGFTRRVVLARVGEFGVGGLDAKERLHLVPVSRQFFSCLVDGSSNLRVQRWTSTERLFSKEERVALLGPFVKLRLRSSRVLYVPSWRPCVWGLGYGTGDDSMEDRPPANVRDVR